jgi:murein DD-endopeptidase MepM/ murein hydrolase activator NlpD
MPTLGSRKPVISNGWRPTPTTPGSTYTHHGADIMYRRQSGEPSTPPGGSKHFSVPPGTPVVAAAAGVIEYARKGVKHGGQVVVRHSTNLRTFYSHLAPHTVKTGQAVAAGQVLGKAGDSPSVNDPRHLHFEVWTGPKDARVKVNPSTWLKNAGMVTPPATPGFPWGLVGLAAVAAVVVAAAR